MLLLLYVLECLSEYVRNIMLLLLLFLFAVLLLLLLYWLNLIFIAFCH